MLPDVRRRRTSVIDLATAVSFLFGVFAADLGFAGFDLTDSPANLAVCFYSLIVLLRPFLSRSLMSSLFYNLSFCY